MTAVATGRPSTVAVIRTQPLPRLAVSSLSCQSPLAQANVPPASAAAASASGVQAASRCVTSAGAAMVAGVCATPSGVVTSSLSRIVRPARAVRAGNESSSGRRQVPVSAGAGVSWTTVTWNVALASLPAASVAVQVTVVVPTGNDDPLAGSQATVGEGSVSSVTVGSVQETVAASPVVVAPMYPGTPWRTGSVVSAGGGGTTFM